MEPRFAFTAQFWGDGAVVCRAVQDRPGPVVEQQFGEFKTWTQAQSFATKLNEGLDLDRLAVRQIVTSSLLATAGVVQETLNSASSWAGSPVEVAAHAVQLQFILSELAFALTLCRSAAYLSDASVRRIASNVQKVLRQSAYFLNFFDGNYTELKDIAARTRELNSAFQHVVSCLPEPGRPPLSVGRVEARSNSQEA